MAGYVRLENGQRSVSRVSRMRVSSREERIVWPLMSSKNVGNVSGGVRKHELRKCIIMFENSAML